MKLYVLNGSILKKAVSKIVWIMILILMVSYGTKVAVDVFSVPIRNMVIVIDAGHGGMDPGAIGSRGVAEEHINLNIALKLRRLIEQGGGTAIMIREEDSGLYTEGNKTVRAKKNEDLKNRRNMINNTNADLYISIHLNSFPETKYYGAQTFYQKGDKGGQKLAELIQGELKNTLDKQNHRVAKPISEIYIMKNNSIPGALVECGFLSNREEEKLLTEDHYQEKIAWGKLQI